MKISALILAKSDSKRLPNKNTLDFNGEPMFLTNVRKCFKIFDKVYVSSDSLEILNQAMKVGAIPIKRPKELCGDTPNIPVYQHAVKQIECDVVIAVQANSPTVKPEVIQEVKDLMEFHSEVMTCHPDKSVYGSVWGITIPRLMNYTDAYKQTPDLMIIDDSIDIHTQEDYKLALQWTLQ